MTSLPWRIMRGLIAAIVTCPLVLALLVLIGPIGPFELAVVPVIAVVVGAWAARPRPVRTG